MEKGVKLKNKKGITLVALVITIIVLLILAGVTISLTIGQDGIITRAQEAGRNYTNAQDRELADINNFINEIDNRINNFSTNGTIVEKGEEFNRSAAPGKIEVVFIDKDNKIIEEPLAPVLKGNMQPLKLNSEGTDFETTTVANWGYNYVAGTGTETNTSSIWANAQTKDGSMFVWIPRYAYKITYYDTDGTTILGYSCARGIIDANGKVVYANAEGIETVEDYIVHPAFTDSVENGGWSEDLAGIWMGKFDLTGSLTTPTVKPAEAQIEFVTPNDFYTACLEAKFGETVTINSHMIKNSEYGAVTYLTHSQYGTNGKLIGKNQNTNYTGGSDIISEVYTTYVNLSSTQNAYGVYLERGTSELVASYVNNGGSTISGVVAGTTEEEKATSTEYKTVYKGTGVAEDDYALASTMRGDGIFETSSAASGTTGWFSGTSNFPVKTSPFFMRGGVSSGEESLFRFKRIAGGSSSTSGGTRVCLCFN